MQAQIIRTEILTWFYLQKKIKLQRRIKENKTKKLDWGSLYPAIPVDRPIKLTKLERRWIGMFCLHLANYVRDHPEKFEDYDKHHMYETYRRRLFVYWMNTFGTKQLEFEKQQLEASRELRRLTSKRQRLTVIACSDGWDPRAYD